MLGTWAHPTTYLGQERFLREAPNYNKGVYSAKILSCTSCTQKAVRAIIRIATTCVEPPCLPPYFVKSRESLRKLEPALLWPLVLREKERDRGSPDSPIHPRSFIPYLAYNSKRHLGHFTVVKLYIVFLSSLSLQWACK